MYSLSGVEILVSVVHVHEMLQFCQGIGNCAQQRGVRKERFNCTHMTV